MLATINLQTILLFIHVSAAVVGLGATFALAVAFPVAIQLGEPRNLPFVHRLSLEVTRKLAHPALAGDPGHRHLPGARRRLRVRRAVDQRRRS